MVQVLPKVPGFGERFAESLSRGMEKGLDQSTNFAQQMALEKQRYQLKQGLQLKQAEAGINAAGYGNQPNVITSQDQPFANVSREPQITPVEQLDQKAAQWATERNNRGLPTTIEEGRNHVREKNQDILQQRNLKNSYADIGQVELEKVMKNPSGEDTAIIRKKLENQAYEGLGESDIRRLAAKEASKYKNTISRIENSIPPKRIGKNFKEMYLGNGRDAEKNRNSMRLLAKPLLEEGQYQKARELYSRRGYSPEEVESFITELGEGSKRALAELPNFKTLGTYIKKRVEHPFTERRQLPEKEQQIFQENLKNAFEREPSVNPLLLRRAYEEKGVDWRSFQDALENLMSEGQIQLNEDQEAQWNHLTQPPLNNLEKILYKFNLIGR